MPYPLYLSHVKLWLKNSVREGKKKTRKKDEYSDSYVFSKIK
jgi:hypothetical protein